MNTTHTGDHVHTPYYIGEQDDMIHESKLALTDGAAIAAIALISFWLVCFGLGCS